MNKAIFKKNDYKNFAMYGYVVIENINYDNIFSLDFSLQSNDINIRSVSKK